MTVKQVVNVDELQILLNILGDHLTLRYPLYDFDILTARPVGNEYKITIKCKKEGFEKETSEFGEHSSEMPQYSDFIEGLLCSGVLQYSNLDDCRNEIAQYHKSSRSKSVCFSADTNIFYHRFFSTSKLIKPTEVVLVETVGEEIEAALNHKLSSTMLSEMKRSAKFQKQLLDSLINRKTKRARKAAYIAQREYKMIEHGASKIAGVERATNDTSLNDGIIVKTLHNYEGSAHNLLVFLTADDCISDVCKSENLEVVKFDVPYYDAIDSCHANANQFRELVFNLARVFGFVQLGSVILFGEYKEKSSNNPDQVLLEFQNEEIFPEFEKDLRICRRLLGVGLKPKLDPSVVEGGVV